MKHRGPDLSKMGDADYTAPWSVDEHVMPTIDEDGFGETEMWEAGWKLRFGAPACALACDMSPYEAAAELHEQGMFEGVSEYQFDTYGESVYVYFKTEEDARRFCENLQKFI